MKTKFHHSFTVLALLALLTLNLPFSTAQAQGTAFTYQGQLQNNGSPASGTYNLTFSLFDTNTSGVAIAKPVTNNAVVVTNGLFTVQIDFGSDAFTGETNWLQIGVETNGVSSFTPLTPRQPLTPVPYAIFANTASNLSGTIQVGQLSGTVPLAQLPGAVVTSNESSVTLSNLTVSGILSLPSPATIDSGGGSLLHFDSLNNFYAGSGAGTLTNLGGGNTGTGYIALSSNTNGANNTADGYRALANNTSGDNNTANGEQALYLNTSGSNNTAVGRHALDNNLNGNENTGLGEEALLNNTNGGQNTALGASALDFSTSGSNNIALGYQAGVSFTGNESGNIDIGNPGAPDENNIIRIGNGQTNTFIAGVINGNGGGLTNLNASQLTGGAFSGNGSGLTNLNAGQLTSGTVPLAQLPDAVVTNNEPAVSLGTLTLGGLMLPDPTTINVPVRSPFSPYPIINDTLLISDFANDNLYLGQEAGSANGGFGNTGMGAFVLGQNTNGNYNTGVGFEALYANTSGNYNTANGYQALDFNTSGSNNIAIGNGGGNNITAGNNNIDIGNQGVSSDSDIIRIGTPGTHTQTFIAGVINGNGGGLTNLSAAQLSGAITLAQLPVAVVTNNDSASVTLSGTFSGNGGGLTNLNVSAAQVTGLPNLQQIALLKWGVSSADNTFSVGIGPDAICFDGASIWVANDGGNTVTKLNASTGAAIGTYNVGINPYAICFDGASIWVANGGGNTVTKLNAGTGATGTYNVGSDPSGICFDGANIWVANTGDNTVTKLNAGNGATLGTYNVGSGPDAICFDGASIWVANSGGNTVTKLNASTGAAIGTYNVGSGPYGICFDGASIWVANQNGNNVTKL